MLFFSQIHSPLKANSQQKIEKPRRKTKGHEGKRNNWGKPRPPRPWLPPRSDRGSHHGPSWCPWPGHGYLWPLGCGFLALPHFGASFWFAGFWFGSSVLGPLGFFCNHSWLGWPQFLSLFDSTRANLQSKHKQAKTECNRRNMCVNRKILQINHHIESKSF